MGAKRVPGVAMEVRLCCKSCGEALEGPATLTCPACHRVWEGAATLRWATVPA